MKVKLYKCFEHWYHGGTIWVISDTHFQKDTEMEQFFGWPSAEERLKMINECVTKNDTLIHLGDVGDRLDLVRQIKCDYKVLITGNHDAGNSVYERGKQHCGVLDTNEDIKKAMKSLHHAYMIGDVHPTEYKQWGNGKYELLVDNHLFDEIYNGPLFINQKILLSHERVELPFAINIHGHEHSQSFITCKSNIEYGFVLKASDLWCTEFNGHSYCINLAADVVGFKPIRLDKLLEYVPQNAVKSIHELCVEQATERKKNEHKEY